MDSIAILLGWPSLIAALILAAIGSIYRSPVWLIVATALTLPMSLYLAATPAMPIIGLAPSAALAVTAYRCRTSPRWHSAIGVAIYSGFLFWLALLVVAD